MRPLAAMGAKCSHSCCASEAKASGEQEALHGAASMPVLLDSLVASDEEKVVDVAPTNAWKDHDVYSVTLDKRSGKMGLDIDYIPERKLLPIFGVTSGSAREWNAAQPEELRIKPGDAIVEVNGAKGDAKAMLDKCQGDLVLRLVLMKGMSREHLGRDLEALVKHTGCGPRLVRLAWQAAPLFSRAGPRPGSEEGSEESLKCSDGLPATALALLVPISARYCPHFISNADLWVLAADVAIRMMSGPHILTRFGRPDGGPRVERGQPPAERLGESSAEELRATFQARGFNDEAIVALSGAHTIGRCHVELSYCEGAWTEQPLVFDNSYFKAMLRKEYMTEASSASCPQVRPEPSGTIMLASDLVLLSDPSFREHVERYANDETAFFQAFHDAWVKAQDFAFPSLRDNL